MTPGVVVSLGSNLGDRLAHLAAGLSILDAIAGVAAVSGVYETDPVGGVRQPPYLNLVAVLRTGDPELALLAAHAAEDARGRLRSVRWGPRTLDVDVIACGACRVDDPWLTVPHPRASERAFVLRPWLDVDPAAWLPGSGPVAPLARELGDAGVRRVGPAPGWWR